MKIDLILKCNNLTFYLSFIVYSNGIFFFMPIWVLFHV